MTRNDPIQTGADSDATVVAEWPLTKTEVLRVIVYLDETRLHERSLMIDVRRWFYDSSRKLCPRKQGLLLTPGDLRCLRKALRKAEREVAFRDIV